MRIHLYSLHGLFRGQDLEIGRDADNGGQIIYVMELAQELSNRAEVTHVDLFTRRIEDKTLSSDYAQEVEQVNEKLTIRRVACGGKRYLAKEKLWPHLDEFVSNTIKHIKRENVFPTWMHSHYADAAYVTAELSGYLNVPFAHSAHSLGKPKLRKLLLSGMPHEEAMRKLQFARRFEAEEIALANAEFTVTSTETEIALYDEYENHKQSEFHVIPPGIGFQRFYPYYEDLLENTQKPELEKQAMVRAMERMDKFLTDPNKPLILAICRPDKKKNIEGLIKAYGEDPIIQKLANLAIFAGIREDIDSMAPGEKEVLTQILLLIDKYNLYGKLAIPKRHDSEWEVPEIYRLCAQRKGIFANVALTEQFGLTLLEATACGLPVVATNHGGPSEIVPKCNNGVLVEPENTESIQEGIRSILMDEDKWQTLSDTGIRRVRECYSWPAHVDQYLKLVRDNFDVSGGRGLKNVGKDSPIATRLKSTDRMLVSDIDGTLISDTGDHQGLDELRDILHQREDRFIFAVATGRSLQLVKDILQEHDMPDPDVIISSVGTQIHYGFDERYADKGWQQHIRYRWDRSPLQEKALSVRGIKLQEPENQLPHKISFYIDDQFDERELFDALSHFAHRINVLISRDAYVDILPKRASKGRAIRYISQKWSVPMPNTVVCGDSGNDLDMFNGSIRSIIVGNYAPELETLKKRRRVYFSSENSSAGVIEGLKRFQFID